jgi:hypothetical protein
MTSAIGRLLDGVACGVAGHIWVQHPEVDGVMICARCGRAGQNRRTRVRRRPTPPDAVIPEEDRPWMKPPYAAGEH